MVNIKISNLLHRYNDATVLDIPDLELNEEKIFAIIGPSGAGKSTLLRLINGLEMPSKGLILFNGDVVSPEESRLMVRRQMATVFQKPSVFNSSVAENVAYGLNLRGESKKTTIERVDEALEFVGLQSKKRQNARTLSGGEMQRVAMAMALVTRPKLFLLDEPTANLDPSNVAICEELITSARDKYQMTVILVTHNMYQAKRIADKTMLLLSGQIIETGLTKDLFSKPTDHRTASFIRGEMIY